MVTLPPGVTFVSSSLGSGGCSGTGIIQCRVGNIGNGTEATVEMSFLPTAEGEKRTKAEVSAGPVDPDMGNNSVMAAVVVHPLPVSETPPPPISDGDGAGTPPAPNAGGDGGGAPPVPSGGGEGAVVPPSSGKSGGGCAMKTGSDSDPTLIGLFLLALVALLRKEMKRSKRKPIENGKIILP
jgi:hypothetical protein